MSTHKHFDRICCVVLALTLVITLVFMNGDKLGLQKASSVMGYETKLFDTSTVHTINIVMDDWDEFVENCESEEYYDCSVVIDNEAYKNVAIRGKGNTSLTQVKSYGNDRYSFKIEFDHYDSSKTYHGLDKLCLNNIIQDNTYMKDYLTYEMMRKMGVASPLCSYTYITVNGEDWGLYLAVEGVEESFLQRNYGKDYGELYKPDSMSMGGGRGNGEKFDMDEFEEKSGSANEEAEENTDNPKDSSENQPNGEQPGKGNFDGELPDMSQFNGEPSNQGQFQEGAATDSEENESEGTEKRGGQMMDGDRRNGSGNGGGMNSSEDVLLKYIDDEADSYSNIFENAKTDITDQDKTRLIEALKNLSEQEDLEDTVEIETVIRYFVVHNFVLNFDSYTGSMIHNYYLYEKEGQMQMIPWDYNLAFGGFQSMGGATSLVNYPIDSPISGGNVEDRPMIAWIFANEDYTELYHEYFAEFISEYFESGYFEEMMDSVTELIAPYVEKDPTKFCTYEEFETGIATLKEFCLLRSESIIGQLEGTIGSTSETQETDTLIDAGSLQISDMGSMNQSMGGDQKNQPGGNAEQSEDKNGQNNGTVEEPNSDTGVPQGEDGASDIAPELPEGDMEPPDGGNGTMELPEGGMQMPEGGNGMTEPPDGAMGQPGGEMQGEPGGGMNGSGGMGGFGNNGEKPDGNFGQNQGTQL